VGGEVCVGALQTRLVAAGDDDAALELVAHHGCRDPAEEGEGPGMAGDPVGDLLGAGGLGVGVVGGAQRGDEQLDRHHLAGGGVEEPRLLAGVVDEALVAGAVDLAHGEPAPLEPAPVQVAEARIAIAVGMPLQILQVQQLERDARLASLGVNPGTVRRRALSLPGHLRPPIEPALQGGVGQQLHLGPVQTGPLSPGEHAGDRAHPDAQALGHRPVGEPQGPLLSEDLSNLSHG
jgi:hypothetical protein